MILHCPHCDKNMPLKVLLSAANYKTCPHCQQPIKARLNLVKSILLVLALVVPAVLLTNFLGVNSTLGSALIGGVFGVIALLVSYKFEKTDSNR